MSTVTGAAQAGVNAACTVTGNGLFITHDESAATAQSIENDIATLEAQKLSKVASGTVVSGVTHTYASGAGLTCAAGSVIEINTALCTLAGKIKVTSGGDIVVETGGFAHVELGGEINVDSGGKVSFDSGSLIEGTAGAVIAGSFTRTGAILLSGDDAITTFRTQEIAAGTAATTVSITKDVWWCFAPSVGQVWTVKSTSPAPPNGAIIDLIVYATTLTEYVSVQREGATQIVELGKAGYAHCRLIFLINAWRLMTIDGQNYVVSNP